MVIGFSIVILDYDTKTKIEAKKRRPEKGGAQNSNTWLGLWRRLFAFEATRHSAVFTDPVTVNECSSK